MIYMSFVQNPSQNASKYTILPWIMAKPFETKPSIYELNKILWLDTGLHYMFVIVFDDWIRTSTSSKLAAKCIHQYYSLTQHLCHIYHDNLEKKNTFFRSRNHLLPLGVLCKSLGGGVPLGHWNPYPILDHD